MSTTCRRFVSSRMIGFSVSERERGDGVDVALHLVHDAAGVGPEVELDRHRAHPLVRRRADLLDAVDALDRLLDADGHRRLDLLGGGAEIQDFNADRSSFISGNTPSLALVAARSPLATMNTLIRFAATPLRANHSILPCTLAFPLRKRPPAQAAGKSAGSEPRSARRALLRHASRAGPIRRPRHPPSLSAGRSVWVCRKRRHAGKAHILPDRRSPPGRSDGEHAHRVAAACARRLLSPC